MPETTAEPTVDIESENPVVQETPDIESEIMVGSEKLTLIETKIKKGKGKGEVRYYIKVDFAQPDPFAQIKRAVGLENFNRAVYSDLIRPNCNFATHDATKDGQVTDADWAKQFSEQFLPDSRKSTTGKKQLEKQQAGIFSEIQPLLLRQAHGEKLSADENNRLLQLLADFGEINTKIESKTRKGKKAKETATTPVAKT